MRCEDCGEYLEEHYMQLHKRQFCRPTPDFRLGEFFKYKPFRYTMFGLSIWTIFWLMVWIYS